ncbi:MAG: arylsulfatase [Akkermansiaceae bacterium]
MKFSFKTLGFFFFGLAALNAKTKQPNIVVILVDDMGYGDLRSFNPESKIPTPNLDRLAAEGMRFTDAHAPGPLCHPSRYGLMTGRFPFRTDTSKWRKQPLIEADRLTLPKLLSDNGYQTAMVGKWHLGFEEKGYDKPLKGGPIDQGFDSFFGIRASTDIPPYFYIRGDQAVMPPSDQINENYTDGWSKIQGAFWRGGGIAPDLKLPDVLPKFTNEACEVLKTRDGDKPLFLYLAYPAPHTPWLPAEEFKGKSGAGMYGDFMMMVDSEIGRVMATLKEVNMDEDTLVIFTSDNGPVWYPNDVENFEHSSVGTLRGMKGDAWEGGHRMPFIARWPGKIEKESVSPQTISFTDCLATIAELLEEKISEDLDSVSFLQALFGKELPPRSPIVMRSANGTMLVRMGDWKLIDAKGSGGFSKSSKSKEATAPKGQLYDLSKDLGERKNLYEKMPKKVEELEKIMKRVINASH